MQASLAASYTLMRNDIANFTLLVTKLESINLETAEAIKPGDAASSSKAMTAVLLVVTSYGITTRASAESLNVTSVGRFTVTMGAWLRSTMSINVTTTTRRYRLQRLGLYLSVNNWGLDLA